MKVASKSLFFLTMFMNSSVTAHCCCTYHIRTTSCHVVAVYQVPCLFRLIWFPLLVQEHYCHPSLPHIIFSTAARDLRLCVRIKSRNKTPGHHCCSPPASARFSLVLSVLLFFHSQQERTMAAISSFMMIRFSRTVYYYVDTYAYS